MITGLAPDMWAAAPSKDWSQIEWPARYAIAERLGRDDPSYHGRVDDGLITWRDAAGQVSASFDDSGASLVIDGYALKWRPVSLGRGETASGLEDRAATPRLVEPNRVEYTLGALKDWYVNGPFGMQHGMTIHSPPAGRQADIWVDVTADRDGERLGVQVAADGRSLVLADGARPVVTYGRLVVVDADGNQLPAELLASPEATFRIRVDDRGARYPLTIDPFMRRATLIPSDGADGDEFGVSVAADGDVVVVGARGSDSFTGAVYVFEKGAGGWGTGTETARLTASDGVSGDQLGDAVAIDGDVIVAGAPRRSGGQSGFRNGAVYLFERPGASWTDATQTAILTAGTQGSFDLLGTAVAIDGDVVAAGVPGRSAPLGSQGAIMLFAKPQGGWANMNETAVLTASDAAQNDRLGEAVDLFEDIVVAGSPLADTGGVDANEGAVYVFTEPGTGWSGTVNESAKLTGLGAAQDAGLGSAVSIHGDTIAAGAPGDSVAGVARAGAAYVFERAGSWSSGTQTARLTAASPLADDRFGFSLAVSGDGALVGRSSGAHAYWFEKPVAGWADATEDALVSVPGEGDSSQLGFAVDLLDDALVVAAKSSDVHEPGAAYILQTCGVVSSSKSLSVNAWTLVGLPCDPEAPGTVESVFGDDLDPARYATRWVMYAYDPVLDDYVMLGLDDPLVPGAGYWILSLDAAELDVEGAPVPVVQSAECVTPAGCFEIELLGPEGIVDVPEFQLIGMPFPADSIPWKDVRIVEPDGTTYTPSSAQSWDIMSRTFFKYDGSGYVAYDDTTVGMEGVLEPFDGVWISSLMSTIPGATFPAGTKILIPFEPLSTPPSP